MSSSWYLQNRPLSYTKIDGKTEAEDLQEIADWVADTEVTQITNEDKESHLERILRRPDVGDNIVDTVIIRVSRVVTLRSIPGPAHLRVLNIHKDTRPQARLVSNQEQVSVPLSLDNITEFRGRVEISPGVDALVILKRTST